MKKILLLLSFFMLSFVMVAQSVDDVTLVVSGDGVTKSDAITAALRSAIEQAYGVFVSANTEILNDELIKDEIATVSSGNVKSYKELGCAVTADGSLYMVTLEAVVSVKQLAQYAASKGASCEFAGAVLDQTLKLLELNKRNTQIAFDNMLKQLELIAPFLYDYELSASEPIMNGSGDVEFDVTVGFLFSRNYYDFCKLILSTLSSLNVEDIIKGYKTYDYRQKFPRNSFRANKYKLLASFPTQRFNALCYNAYCNFVVCDNNGKYWEPKLLDYESYCKGVQDVVRCPGAGMDFFTECLFIHDNSSLDEMLKEYEKELKRAAKGKKAKKKKNNDGFIRSFADLFVPLDSDYFYRTTLKVTYSREELSKLSGLTVERKTTVFNDEIPLQSTNDEIHHTNEQSDELKYFLGN